MCTSCPDFINLLQSYTDQPHLDIVGDMSLILSICTMLTYSFMIKSIVPNNYIQLHCARNFPKINCKEKLKRPQEARGVSPNFFGG